jgi:hypothetical protein
MKPSVAARNPEINRIDSQRDPERSLGQAAKDRVGFVSDLTHECHQLTAVLTPGQRDA